MDEPSGHCPATLNFRLACDFNAVRGAAQRVHRFLAAHGVDEDTLMACDLALVEGCNNAIKYAPATARSTPVIVGATCNDGRIELRVTDHTAGFDWPAELALPDPESESGRGLFLIHSLMDEARYERGDGTNVLILRKTFPRS